MITTFEPVTEPLFIEKTRTTPVVSFEPEKNRFEISGVSFPEDSKAFFEPLVNYLNSAAGAITAEAVFDFKLDYFNTSSARCLLDVLFAIDRCYRLGKQVTINWYYNAGDEELREVGEEFDMLINCPINLKVVV